MTTDPIRQQVVEAMAQAMFGTTEGPLLAVAGRALDAALDVLGEQGTDWADEDLLTLVAVLRAGKGSDQ